MYYYRIYDDKEELNFFKSSLGHKQIEALLKDFEKTHETYCNPEFIEYLRKKDTEAEIIQVEQVTY